MSLLNHQEKKQKTLRVHRRKQHKNEEWMKEKVYGSSDGRWFAWAHICGSKDPEIIFIMPFEIKRKKKEKKGNLINKISLIFQHVKW